MKSEVVIRRESKAICYKTSLALRLAHFSIVCVVFTCGQLTFEGDGIRTDILLSTYNIPHKWVSFFLFLLSILHSRKTFFHQFTNL